LLPYVVPSPGALLTTRVKPGDIISKNLPSHYEFIRTIRAKLLQWSPATFIGYNSISYDEELLRQAFFQSLYNPYLTNTKGNSRADIMKIAHAVSVYAPGVIKVPTLGGKETFKLDRLAPENGFAHDDAHEALADVRATIYMAQLMKDAAPDVWAQMAMTSKKKDAVDYALSEKMFSLTERMFNKNYSWLVAPCGTNPKNNGQIGVFDLAYNPDDFCSLSVEQLIAVMGSKEKAVRSVRGAAQPIMMSANLAPENTKALELSPEEIERRANVVAADQNFQNNVQAALAGRFEGEEPSPYVEKQIYDGFVSDADGVIFEKFHGAEWSARPAIIDPIECARSSEFARRLIWVQQASLHSDQERERLKKWFIDRVTTEEEVPWTTIKSGMAEADKHLKDADYEKSAAISDIKDFLSDYGKCSHHDC
jgi:exodeoxyribonuclease-1